MEQINPTGYVTIRTNGVRMTRYSLESYVNARIYSEYRNWDELPSLCFSTGRTGARWTFRLLLKAGIKKNDIKRMVQIEDNAYVFN